MISRRMLIHPLHLPHKTIRHTIIGSARLRCRSRLAVSLSTPTKRSMAEYEPSSKKDVHSINRYAHRAVYDANKIYGILDEGVVGHVTFALPPEDNDQEREYAEPALPYAYGRVDDVIYLHGHTTARLMKALATEGVKASMTVTTVQGFIIALAPYHNDVQFKSAVLFGQATLCTGEEQLVGLKAITNEIWRNVPYDRYANCRQPTDAELKATKVIKMQIERASAKIGDSHVEDEQKDIDAHQTDYWAGVIKREERWTKAESADFCKIAQPDFVTTLLQQAQ